jgi:hypothetical protein
MGLFLVFKSNIYNPQQRLILTVYRVILLFI